MINIKYKYKFTCIVCKKEYGSDYKNDNEICHQCGYIFRKNCKGDVTRK